MRTYRSLTFSFACLSLLIFSSCAEKWEKPGAGEVQFDAMRSSCVARASAKFPPLVRYVPINDGYVTPTTTSCNEGHHYATCTQSGGNYVAPAMMAVDDNDRARGQAVRACFYENGWHPAKD